VFQVKGTALTKMQILVQIDIQLRDENHPCFSCWDGVLWLDTWKKTVIYWCFAVLLFAQPHRIWFSTSAGSHLNRPLLASVSESD
jgi:hypothetical protein